MKRWQLLKWVTIALILFLWEVLVRAFNIPNYILPGSFEVFGKLFRNIDVILIHATITMSEALIGLFLGMILALILSIVAVHSRFFEQVIHPLIVASQTIPKVAIAPLLIIWFGSGISSKIAIATIMGFFPIVINLSAGLKNIDSESIDLFRVYRASKLQVFLKARIPSALPYFFVGLRISVALCFIGAVVGEFVGADSGLGYLIVQADSVFDVGLEFACVVFLALMANLSLWLIFLIERKVVYWQ